MMAGADWWFSGRANTLPPCEQAKAWALTFVIDHFDVKLAAHEIASVLKVVGGGCPKERAVQKWQAVFRSDEPWYRGKTLEEGKENGSKPGPKPLFTGQNKNAVAQAAMAEKRAGREASVAAVRLRCEKAVINPSTGQPFTDKYILQVFRNRCYDDGSELPWGHILPYPKTALSVAMQAMRYTWANAELAAGNTPAWFHRNVVWFDPCSSILSVSERSAFDEHQSTYGKGKRWMSPDKRKSSRNMRSSPYASKQKHKGDKRLWWFVILARGVVKFEAMEDTWTQTGEGMSRFVAKLTDILKAMLGDETPLPRMLYTDRGPGLFQGSTGHIVKAYEAAVERHGFRTYVGSDASKQPGDIADCLPHETAVAWARAYLKKRPLDRSLGLDGMAAKLRRLLHDCEGYINSEYDVDKLCGAEFLERMAELKDREGDRLKS